MGWGGGRVEYLLIAVAFACKKPILDPCYEQTPFRISGSDRMVTVPELMGVGVDVQGQYQTEILTLSLCCGQTWKGRRGSEHIGM